MAMSNSGLTMGYVDKLKKTHARLGKHAPDDMMNQLKQPINRHPTDDADDQAIFGIHPWFFGVDDGLTIFDGMPFDVASIIEF